MQKQHRNIPAAKSCFAAYSPPPVGGAEAPSAPLTPASLHMGHLKSFQVTELSKRKNNVSLFTRPSVRLLLSLRPMLTTEAVVMPRSSSPRRTKPRPSCRPAASPTAAARLSLPLVSQPTAARFHTEVGFLERGHGRRIKFQIKLLLGLYLTRSCLHNRLVLQQVLSVSQYIRLPAYCVCDNTNSHMRNASLFLSVSAFISE